MAQLQDRVQNALEEGRMLILGSLLLLGLQLHSFLEKGFTSLPPSSQFLKLLAFGLLLLAFALLVAPTAYHRIVERGEETEEIRRYTTRVMAFALLPFALALGLDIHVAASKIAGPTAGAVTGVLACAAALFFWYGLDVVPRGGRSGARKEVKELENTGPATEGGEKPKREESELKDRIRHVLAEARTLLPGAQALLGFQLIAILMEGFDRLPAASRYVHLASLVAVCLGVVLLMTPAAYHRIVERGEETEHFHRFAGRMVLAALVPLALGICGDVFVVVRKVLDSTLVATVAAVVALAVFYEFWFGLTVYRRVQRDQNRPQAGGQSLFGAKQ